jgi:hypothetical protein
MSETVVIGYDALFGKSRMSYIRSFLLTVGRMYLRYGTEFLSNPVCRMSYGVMCHVKYRMSYVIPIP